MSLAYVLSIEDEPVYGVRAAVDALRPDQCRCPIGDVKSPTFFFCTNDKEPGSSYCSAHRRLNRRERFTAE